MWGQAVQRLAHSLGFSFLKKDRLRRRANGTYGVQLFRGNFLVWQPVGSALPVVTSISDDAHQPWPALGSPKRMKRANGPQVGFLNYVFCISFVPEQPSRQIVGGVQVPDE